MSSSHSSGRQGRPTVRDIAREAGVSMATVSRALNDHAHVADPTRQRVLQTMEKLGALPAARATPARARAGSVLVRCPYTLTDYFGLIVSAIAEALDVNGRQVVLDAGEAAQNKDTLGRLGRRPDVSGAILILPPEPEQDVARLYDGGFPLVVVDPRTPLPGHVPAVSAANVAGARNVALHLIELGHRDIALLSGPSGWSATRARVVGHVSALAEHGYALDPGWCLHGQATVREGYRLASLVLDGPRQPTAIAMFNDKMAVGAMQAVHERGLRVPQDVSLAGFDDIDLSMATQPMLTTVRQPLREMGRLAVSLLVRLIEGQSIDALHVELATELVVRASTGPVPRP